MDYALERKLKEKNPDLHKIMSANVIACNRILGNVRENFPTFTDHSVLHSLEVLDFCNQLIGEDIDRINPDEIFVLIMAAYLHDIGMTLNEKDFLELNGNVEEIRRFTEKNPDTPRTEVLRRFHHEFSGQFIRKYAALFDFPSDNHLFAVIQISRGHRKTDLFDEKEYPAVIRLENGNEIHLPYLAALIRLADEIDIAKDRNIQFLFPLVDTDSTKDNEATKQSRIEFGKHRAIQKIEIGDDKFTAYIRYPKPDEVYSEEIKEGLDEMFFKIRETIDNCFNVITNRTPFSLRQTHIEVRVI